MNIRATHSVLNLARCLRMSALATAGLWRTLQSPARAARILVICLWLAALSTGSEASPQKAATNHVLGGAPLDRRDENELWLESLAARFKESAPNTPQGAGRWIRKQSGELGLALRSTADGLALESFFDLQNGLELLDTHPAPLFKISLRRLGSSLSRELTSSSGWRETRWADHRDGFELAWRAPADSALSGLAVFATAALTRGQDRVSWRIRVEPPKNDWALWRVTFPELSLAPIAPEGRVFFPRGPGEEQSGVWSRPFHYHGSYPGGWCSMQFMAAYGGGNRAGGIYFGMHDPFGCVKSLDLESDPKSRTLRLAYDHPVPNMGRPGTRFVLSGSAVWQLLRGDWFDAAQLYKNWVRRQARWWPALKDLERPDTPQWMRNLSAWAMTGGDPDQCVPAVLQMQRRLGLPIGFHWYRWHQIPFDNDYPHYFPAKPGFAQAVRELQSSNIFVMPYINGRLWDSHDRGTNDFQFSALARPAVTKREDGQPYLESYGSKETNGQPVRLGVMCPSTALWQKTVSSLVLRLENEVGTKGVYVDQVAAAPPVLCFDRAHGHPLGGGAWWNEGYWKMLSKIRRRIPGDAMLTTECNGEPFVRWFDGYLTWHWQYNGQVPAFPAIYSGAIQMFGRAYRGGPDRNLALRMKAAQQLVFGEQLGWIDPGFLDDPDNAAFFIHAARARHRLVAYFNRGEMMRPPKFTAAIPKVTADWQWSGKWPVTTPAVLAGAWTIPKTRQFLFLFANVSDRPVTSPVQFARQAEAGPVPRSEFNLLEFEPGSDRPILERRPAPLDWTVDLTIAPRSLQAWQIK